MIRIAIVGTGNISHAHVEAYLRFPERCKIVALVDIVSEKAQKMKEDYHLTEAEDRKSTRLNSSHNNQSRMPSSA